MKVSIIGAAGCLGSSAAFIIATRGLAEEMVLLDIRKNLLTNHIMDIGDAVVACKHDVALQTGSYEDMAGSDVVIVAASAVTLSSKASVPESNATHQTILHSRQQLLLDNMPLIADIAKFVDRYCPGAVVITVSNPVEAFNYVCYLRSSTRDRHKFIGYSFNDSIRFQLFVAEAIGVKPSRVQAIVMGEHGDSQVPIFSSVRVDNHPVSLSEHVKQEVRKKAPELMRYVLSLKVARTSGWLSAVGLAAMVNAIRNDTRELFACSVVLAGEYGYRGFSMTVPVILGRQGIHQILEWELDSEEQEGLEQSASIIKEATHIVEEGLRTILK